MKTTRARHLSVFVLAITVSMPAVAEKPALKSVEFLDMPAPATAAEKAAVYTRARAKYVFESGETRTFDLVYRQLMATTQVINGQMVGGLWDQKGRALRDRDGQMASDSPDGNSLIEVPGMRASDPSRKHALALVTQYEFRDLPPNDGISAGGFWSRLPATMSLAALEQDRPGGALAVVDYRPIDFGAVNGGWIHCGSTLSAWNTHIGSEEYEPDAKTREGLKKARDSDDSTDIASFSQYYFGDPDAANPYHYGLVPEVTVRADGSTSVVKHYAPGRLSREMQEMATDNRTAIGGDDGTNTGLFMFVADKAADLSAGTIYAAKLHQRSDADGGAFALDWIRLGHATNTEIAKLVSDGIRFGDIFDVSDSNPSEPGYTRVRTYTGTEWLRLKPGMAKAAAFLETRRYAALLGATTEFSKMEYVAFNPTERKFYIVISRVEKGMADDDGDIRIARNDGGMILEMNTAPTQRDTEGRTIDSDYVGTRLSAIPELLGGWNGGKTDAEGNQCSQDRICGPDNLRYVDAIRTLFIGEDTSRRNNNYVWAFNIDTRSLSRILSVPMAAEATGLTIAPDIGGHAYILSNFQHPGEGDLARYRGADRQAVLDAIDANWDRKRKAAIGYIGTANGALPALTR